jgi:hypothetical protein
MECCEFSVLGVGVGVVTVVPILAAIAKNNGVDCLLHKVTGIVAL